MSFIAKTLKFLKIRKNTEQNISKAFNFYVKMNVSNSFFDSKKEVAFI